jgi:CRP/FNR family transcriptional regulator
MIGATMLTPFQSRAERALAETPLFGELGRELLRSVHRTAVRRGELLFTQGDAGDHLYGLVSGQIKLFSTPEPGREVSLELIAPGELVGELEIADGQRRHASVRALAPSELATITRGTLDTLLDQRPELHAALGRATARTAARFAERAEDVAFLNIERRLEKTLIDLAHRFGEVVDCGTRIRLRQQDLADVLGVSRESVSRALAAPRFCGKLELGRGSIILLGG